MKTSKPAITILLVQHSWMYQVRSEYLTCQSYIRLTCECIVINKFVRNHYNTIIAIQGHKATPKSILGTKRPNKLQHMSPLVH